MSTTKKLGWGSTLATIVENNAGGVGRRYRRSTEGLQPETEEAVDTSLARSLVELGACSGQAREAIEASRSEAELPAQGDAYFHETISPALADHPEAERHVPMLLVTQREDRHVLGEALQCVSGANTRQLRLFTRDILVRLVHADDGSPRTEPLTTPDVRFAAVTAASSWKPPKRGDSYCMMFDSRRFQRWRCWASTPMPEVSAPPEPPNGRNDIPRIPVSSAPTVPRPMARFIGVSHLPAKMLPKPPRKPTALLRVQMLEVSKPVMSAELSHWNQAERPPPSCSTPLKPIALPPGVSAKSSVGRPGP